MSLDPKISFWLNIIYQILTGVTATTLSTLGIADAAKIVIICEAIAGAINIVLHGYSAPIAGPLVKTQETK